jgi:hypothetical protein
MLSLSGIPASGLAAVVEGHLVAVGVGERERAAERPTVPIPSGYTQPSGDIDDTVYLNTQLSGLTPNTTYHDSVSNDGVMWSADATFTTAQGGIPNFRWCGTGDEATSNSSTLPIASLIAAQNPNFTVVAGDLSYASGGILLGSPGTTQPSYSPGAWDTYFGIVEPNAAQ